MIQRSVGRHLRLLRTNDTFNCFRSSQWRPGWSSQQQNRGVKRRGGEAPSVYYKGRRRSAVTPEEIQRQKEFEARLDQETGERNQSLSLQAYQWFSHFEKDGKLSATAKDCHQFVTDFARLLVIAKEAKIGARTSRVIVPIRPYLELQEQHGLSDNDVVVAAVEILPMAPDDWIKEVGMGLTFTASNAGNAMATLALMDRAHLQSKDRPSIMQSSELVGPRQHLRELVQEIMRAEEQRPYAFLWLTLEGQIAYAEGHHDYAIKLWHSALDGAIAHAKAPKEEKKAVAIHLSAPWVELADAYRRNNDYREARIVIEIGCQQDDPTSHYFAALYNRKEENGMHVATSRWLYHVTKAAASGHMRAMHELAGFYISNTWPYLEDEVPDHVKPTPFDQYPPASGHGKTSLRKRILTALGYQNTIEGKPEDAVFHTAAYPHTVEGRLKIAIQWLEVAMGFSWAPSFLLAARMYLNTEIYSDLAAPDEALRLKNTRYVYGSKVEYDAGGKREQPEVPMVPNPLYDPGKAKDLIREIFYAGKALDFLVEFQTGRRGVSRGIQSSFAEVRKSLNYDVDKWFRFPDFYPLFMDVRKGVLHDDSYGVKDLLADAKQICEQEGWDIYAEHDGGLLYRHGMRRR